MNPLFSPRPGCRDDLCQLQSRAYRPPSPLFCDTFRHAAREPLLAVLLKDALQIVSREAIDEIGRRPLRRGAHPHVQRGILLKAETAAGIVELRGAHPEVEENSCRGLEAPVG